ncbi:MAG: phosphotransferase [Pseudomonadales bacterium]|nr:phosphotransferase [Pseudomonadales bacterium]
MTKTPDSKKFMSARLVDCSVEKMGLAPLLFGKQGQRARNLIVGESAITLQVLAAALELGTVVVFESVRSIPETLSEDKFNTILIEDALLATSDISKLTNLLTPTGSILLVSSSLVWLQLVRNVLNSGTVELGDAHTQNFVIFPSKHQPRTYLTLTFRALTKALRRGTLSLRAWLSVLFRKQHILRVLNPDGCFGEVGRALQIHDGSLPTADALHISSTGIIVATAKTENTATFVRIPLGASARRRIHNNYTICQNLESITDLSVPNAIPVTDPTQLSRGETAVGGGPVPLTTNHFRLALAEIAKIHKPFGKMTLCTPDVFQQVVGSKLQFIENQLASEFNARQLDYLLKQLEEKLTNTRITVTLVHGDFKLENCLLMPDGGIGIIDWDMASDNEPSLIDIASIYCRAVRTHKGLSLPQVVLNADGDDPYWPLVCEHLDSVGEARVEPGTLKSLYWLDRVYKQFGQNDLISRAWIDSNVGPVLRHLSQSPRSSKI